jgi:hypothetical protein
MSFITIFSAPKAFSDPHIDIIQRNAIQSWMQLGTDVEVLLVGEESGMSQAARELGVRCLSEVKRNEQGTPLVSDIFEQARKNSSSPFLLYVNADILLMPDMLEAVRCVSGQMKEFLIVGQRWDLEQNEPFDYSGDWAARLRAEIRKRGQLHPPGGSDYFVFPRECFSGIPNFAIGRAGWDNWMIYYAIRQGWEVVDATHDVAVVHQNHDYAHLPGGKTHYTLEESDRNRYLAGGKSHMYVLMDARKRLVEGKLTSQRWSWPRTVRKIELLLMPKGTSIRGWRWELVWKVRRYRVKLEKQEFARTKATLPLKWGER